MSELSRHMAMERLTLLPVHTISAAETAISGTIITGLMGVTVVSVQAIFVYGAGGTTTTVWLQTTLDNGVTWFDIAQWAFTTATVTRIHSVRTATAVAANYTPTDAALGANAIKDGLLGDQLKIKYTTTGTYTGVTTLEVLGVARG